VNVKACDPETGAETATCITLSSGLTDEELEDILEDNPATRLRPATPDTEPAKQPAASAPAQAPPSVEVETPASAEPADFVQQEGIDLLDVGSEDDLYEELELDDGPVQVIATESAVDATELDRSAVSLSEADGDQEPLAAELAPATSGADGSTEEAIVELEPDDEDFFDRDNTNLSAGLDDD
jgi:hypothetical protein